MGKDGRGRQEHSNLRGWPLNSISLEQKASVNWTSYECKIKNYIQEVIIILWQLGVIIYTTAQEFKRSVSYV